MIIPFQLLHLNFEINFLLAIPSPHFFFSHFKRSLTTPLFLLVFHSLKKQLISLYMLLNSFISISLSIIYLITFYLLHLSVKIETSTLKWYLQKYYTKTRLIKIKIKKYLTNLPATKIKTYQSLFYLFLIFIKSCKHSLLSNLKVA